MVLMSNKWSSQWPALHWFIFQKETRRASEVRGSSLFLCVVQACTYTGIVKKSNILYIQQVNVFDFIDFILRHLCGSVKEILIDYCIKGTTVMAGSGLGNIFDLWAEIGS